MTKILTVFVLFSTVAVAMYLALFMWHLQLTSNIFSYVQRSARDSRHPHKPRFMGRNRYTEVGHTISEKLSSDYSEERAVETSLDDDKKFRAYVEVRDETSPRTTAEQKKSSVHQEGRDETVRHIFEQRISASEEEIDGFSPKQTAEKIIASNEETYTISKQTVKKKISAYDGVRDKTSPKQTLRFSSSKSASLAEHRTPQKLLIYMCHKGMCGGWADRQRGLVAVYLLSLVTDRKFGIVMDRPCNVTHYYVPRDVNWIVTEAELRNRTRVTVNDMGSRAGMARLLRTRGFNERYPQDAVLIRTNAMYLDAITNVTRYAHLLPSWARGRPWPVVFATAWSKLMKPSPWLQRHLDSYLRSVGYWQRARPLVCCHVRMGYSDTLKTELRATMNVSDVHVLWAWLERYVQTDSTVFLATDNMEVRRLTRRRFGANMSHTGGAILHVDRDHGAPGAECAGFGSAVLDQLVLTRCDVLLLTRGGFGARAAAIRGTNKDLFQFVKGKVVRIKL